MSSVELNAADLLRLLLDRACLPLVPHHTLPQYHSTPRRYHARSTLSHCRTGIAYQTHTHCFSTVHCTPRALDDPVHTSGCWEKITATSNERPQLEGR
eukprot:3568560-Rhodomonas_salina.1